MGYSYQQVMDVIGRVRDHTYTQEIRPGDDPARWADDHLDAIEGAMVEYERSTGALEVGADFLDAPCQGWTVREELEMLQGAVRDGRLTETWAATLDEVTTELLTIGR